MYTMHDDGVLVSLTPLATCQRLYWPQLLAVMYTLPHRSLTYALWRSMLHQSIYKLHYTHEDTL
jgi:hypothetical protein